MLPPLLTYPCYLLARFAHISVLLCLLANVEKRFGERNMLTVSNEQAAAPLTQIQ